MNNSGMPSPVFADFVRCKIVPVVTLNESADAEPLTEALLSGGLAVAEITLRTQAALRGIERVANREGFLVGAGTVLNGSMCREAIEAGAKFIVSPGLDEEVVSTAIAGGIPCFPGVSTATEVQRAWNLGLRAVKFFPAEAAGGIKMLQALSGPFSNMQFMPTGGISPTNVLDYLKLPSVFAVGDSWMVRPDWIAAREFDKITREAAECCRLAGEMPAK
jgi:2-dehydro-3-deoxyphosphogluconate aldolase/(4S)-4-hydroxy-2-oxoglutarate aldolase